MTSTSTMNASTSDFTILVYQGSFDGRQRPLEAVVPTDDSLQSHSVPLYTLSTVVEARRTMRNVRLVQGPQVLHFAQCDQYLESK